MSRATDDYFDSPLSRRAGVQPPSWITFDEGSNSIRFPTKGHEPSFPKRAVNAMVKVLAFPLRPLRRSRCGREDNPETRFHPRSIDPTEAWKTKSRLLEMQNDRLSQGLEDLRRDYSKLYTRAQHSDARSAHADWKFNQLREAYEDLSRVVYETYGKEEFRALKRKIEEEKKKVVGERKRYLMSSSVLNLNTVEGDECESGDSRA